MVPTNQVRHSHTFSNDFFLQSGQEYFNSSLQDRGIVIELLSDHAQLTMKFLCLFKLCFCNIFPTSNASCLSSDMGNLTYAIDKHFEFVDFGRPVINKMMNFAFSVTIEGKLLLYLALITRILKIQGITPTNDKEIVKTRHHQPGHTIG